MQTGIKVGDIMSSRLVTIPEDAPAFKAAMEMKRRKVGSLIVLNKKKQPIAIVTKSDLVYKALAVKKTAVKAAAIASKPLIAISVSADVSDAAKKMRDRGVKRLVVQNGSTVAGMISQKDIIRVSPSLYDLIAEQEHVGWAPEYAKRIETARQNAVLG